MVEVHDLHVWTVTSGFPALSAHVLVEPGADCHAARRRLEQILADRFGLSHTTLQVDHASPRSATVELGEAVARSAPLADRVARCPSLEGKTAVLTGASSGIGAATALALAREGARVVGGARRAERIAAPIVALEVDVTDPESCERFVDAAVEELGRHRHPRQRRRASRSAATSFDESTEDGRAVVLETNVNGLIRMTRLTLPHLRDGGHIVNIGSVAGRQAYEKAVALRHLEVRGARLHVRAARGSARPADPHHDGRSRARRDGLLARPLPRRRGDREPRSTRASRPMQPEDIADCILFAVTRPPHVNVDELVVKALAQSSGGRIRPKRELMAGQLRILEGATFCICDEVGDLHHQGEGLFSEDTRFLSRFRLTINGQRPLLLSSDKIEYFSAAFFMRNPLAGGLQQDVLSIRRERFVGDGMQDSFAVQNQGMEPVEFDFELEVAHGLRGHLRREGLRLRARRSAAREAAARSPGRTTTTRSATSS